jgi:hypothetical protein
VSNSPIAAGQHAELLTIDTACHRLGGATGAIDRLAGGGVLSSNFHMNRLSIHGDRIVPRSTSSITFTRDRSTGNTWETHLNERVPLLNMFNAALPESNENLPIGGGGTVSTRWSVFSLGPSPREAPGRSKVKSLADGFTLPLNLGAH